MGVMIAALLVFLTRFPHEVLGCAHVRPGQERNVTIILTGFTLPVQMTFGPLTVQNQVRGISVSSRAASQFIHNIVFDVTRSIVEQHLLRSFHHNVVVSGILSQLTIQTTHRPLRCGLVVVNPAPHETIKSDPTNKEACFIIGNTVSAICPVSSTNASQTCALVPSDSGVIGTSPIPDVYTTVTVALKIKNLVMASWPIEKWRKILNSVPELLQLRGENFIGVNITVS